MHGKLRLRHIPRRLRRADPGSILPKIAVLLAAALLLRFFFSLVSASGAWIDSIDTAFFHTVLSAELGFDIEESLSVFSRNSLVTGQSAILSGGPSYPFEILPDDNFDGSFPDYHRISGPTVRPADSNDPPAGYRMMKKQRDNKYIDNGSTADDPTMHIKCGQ